MASDVIDTANQRMRELYRISTERIARAASSVLIFGESGTGKERMAGLLHAHSQRSRNPFIKVNCAALPEGILESELFGHEKGAFTGAIARRQGCFERAHTGTIFLDEVADLSPLVQAKLLRVIQEREFERVGGSATIKVDVRIIAATNKFLEDEVRGGKFREDLYFRLNVISIEIPPLRERKEDIPLLAEKFLEKFCIENQRKRQYLTSDTEDYLQCYHWPGNIRELENLIERLTVLVPADTITIEDLPREITNPEQSSPNIGINHPPTLKAAREQLERGMIEQTLARCRGNVTASSAILGIARKNLQHKIRQYGIEPAQYRGQRADTEA
ncbi:hypothetical protein CEE37_03365 [candidate division LCP-89 bacterium B3_LCP]|uniref:Sigma-54 factor interaction domain-containing protein n=1 Tax=candidate division LCP-89 bacterium B3_LCP TaxID=2012998 RepID=A0A532V3A0_UNCL8|nr:MAG: hypothetical protein CEE37_03365 [candidate division LCP-89 bacterium B3_LCP]